MKNTYRSFVRRTALLLALSLLFSLAACGKAPAQDGAQGSGAPAEAVSDASGPDTPASMKFYKDKVDRMPVSDGSSQGLLYSEVLDFEADGNPELLILSIDDFAKETPGSFLMSIYRYESHGMCHLMNYYITLGAGGGLSLVESGGRLYLERYGCIREESQGVVGYMDNRAYYGSVAQKDGVGRFCDDAPNPGEYDWDAVDALRRDWSEGHAAYFIQPHDERGLTNGSSGYDTATREEYQDAQDRYTTRAVLAYSPDGTSIVIKPEDVPERPEPPEPGPEESQPAQSDPVDPGPAESQQPEEPASLLAAYAGNYTPYPTYDDYSGGRSITLNADGVVIGGETDGQTPTSVVQNSDGSITIWFSSSDRYTLFPVGCSGTPAGTGYDSARVNLEYLYIGGGVMNIIYYADPIS
ncbi:hypothetical protein D3Z48_07655 [Clostridiaceae bacterium]|nr:hypothetical protein [Clostridiaceae bacterium]